MTSVPEPEDLGGYPYGEYVEIDVGLLIRKVASDPGAGPFCYLTPPEGQETDFGSALSQTATGAWLLVLPTNKSGTWSGRVWTTGRGQTSRDIVYEIAQTRNPGP